MGITRKAMLVGAVASLAAAGTASAQGATFTTQGYFSGSGIPSSCTSAAATVATCAGSGFTLVYTGSSANNTTGQINLGSFNLTGTGNVTVPGGGAAIFNLVVNQTQPGSGSQTVVGGLSGTIQTSPTNSSSLIWVPTTNMFSIGAANYQLVYDNAGPAANIGYGISLNSTPDRTINALVTTTPEPSSMALLGTGLVGLVPMVRRRRK